MSTRHSGVNVKSSSFLSYRMIYSSDLSCITCVSHGLSRTLDMTAVPDALGVIFQGPKDPKGSEIIFRLYNQPNLYISVVVHIKAQRFLVLPYRQEALTHAPTAA